MINARFAGPLEHLRRTFLQPSAIVSGRNPDDRPPALIGPFPSVTDMYTDVTVGAEVADLAFAQNDIALEGYRISVFISGHDRHTCKHLTVDIDECDAWLYAVLGEPLADHAYHAGVLNGPAGDGLPGAIFYYVYLDRDREPVPRPETADDSLQVPVRPEAFA